MPDSTAGEGVSVCAYLRANDSGVLPLKRPAPSAPAALASPGTWTGRYGAEAPEAVWGGFGEAARPGVLHPDRRAPAPRNAQRGVAGPGAAPAPPRLGRGVGAAGASQRLGWGRDEGRVL